MRQVALDGALEAVGECAGAGLESVYGAKWAGSALSDVGTIGSPTLFLRSKTTKPRNDKARSLLIYSCPIIATILRRVSTSIFSHAPTT